MKVIDLRGRVALSGRMRHLLGQVIGRFVVLGALAMIGVGLSGVVAAGAGAAFGEAFVAGDPPSVHYSTTACADFLEYAPRAATCEQAATQHHFTEVVWYRIIVGVFGGIAVAAYLFVRRRRPSLLRADLLPAAFAETVAAVAFGLAGVGLVAYGVDQVALGYHGAGFFLSGGVIATAAACAAAVRFACVIDRERGLRPATV